jgi:hypothetical protein
MQVKVEVEKKLRVILNLSLNLNLFSSKNRFKTEAFFRTCSFTSLAAYAVTRVTHLHEHLGGIVTVQLFKLQHIVGTDLVAATATYADFLVNAFHKLGCPFMFVAC